MTTFAHTADAVTFSKVDFPQVAVPPVTRGPVPLVTGNLVYTPEQVAGFTLTENPVADWGVYTFVPGAEEPPGPLEFYTTVRTNALVGPLGDNSSFVQETLSYEQIPIDDLYLIKSAELEQYNAFVRVQSVRSTAPGSTNFWIQLQEADRERQFNATKVLFDRLKDRTLGEDSADDPPVIRPANTYWPNRDPRVVLIRDSNGNRIFAPVDEVSWGHVVKDSGLYDEDRQLSAINVQNAIEVELAADNWQGLADIDVEDRATYGWPEFYEGPVSPTIKPV